jgi:hypothetical protein
MAWVNWSGDLNSQRRCEETEIVPNGAYEKLPLCLIKHRAVKAFGGVEV